MSYFLSLLSPLIVTGKRWVRWFTSGLCCYSGERSKRAIARFRQRAQPPKWIRSFFRRLHKKSGAGGLSRHPNQKEKARVEGTEASLGERDRERAQSQWSSDRLVGAGWGWPVGLAHWSGHPEEARPPERGTLCSLVYVLVHVHESRTRRWARVYVCTRITGWAHRRELRARETSEERGAQSKARTERELRTTSRNRPWRSHRDHLSRLSHLHTWVST